MTTRVLFVSPFPRADGSPNGGVEAAMENLYAGFKGIGGVRGAVLDIRPEYTRPEISAGALGPIYRIPAGSALGRVHRSRSTVAACAKSTGAEIIHSQGAARLLPAGYPKILTVHGFLERDTQFDPGSAARRWLKQNLVVNAERRARDRCENVIAISAFSAAQLDQGHGRRVWHIPNAVHPMYFGSAPSYRRQGVLFAGRISELKGLMPLLEAFAMARQDLPDLRLRLAGPGGDSAFGLMCARRAEELGIRDSVTFLGELDRASLMRELQQTACLVLPSFVEAAPLVIAESLVLGTPVVGTTVGAVPEMVPHVAGRLTRPGDVDGLCCSMLSLLRSSQQEASYEAALAGERYRPSAVASATVAAYREILDRAPSMGSD